jgi:hypothetical protein
MPNQIVTLRCDAPGGVAVFGERREHGHLYRFSRAQEASLALSHPGAFQRVYPGEEELPTLEGVAEEVEVKARPASKRSRRSAAASGPADKPTDKSAGEQASEEGKEEAAQAKPRRSRSSRRKSQGKKSAGEAAQAQGEGEKEAPEGNGGQQEDETSSPGDVEEIGS